MRNVSKSPWFIRYMLCFVIDAHHTSHKHTIRALSNLSKLLVLSLTLPLVSALDFNATIDCSSKQNSIYS